MARARRPINSQRSGLSPELKAIAAIGAAVVIGAIYFVTSDKAETGKAETAVAAADSGDSLQPYSTGAAAHGAATAKAVLVKYTDFQ